MSTELKLLSRRFDGVPDPLALFAELGSTAQVAALFETADAGAKESAESLIFLDPWVTLEAREGQVTRKLHSGIRPDWLPTMSRGGESVRPSSKVGHETLVYPRGPKHGDDVSRLHAESVFDPVRHLLRGLGITEASEAANVCLFGCFAYDLIDDFEVLPEAQKDPTGYPDFSLHLAGSVIRIDHRHGRTTLYSLSPSEHALAARRRLAALEQLCEKADLYRPSPKPKGIVAHLDMSDAEYARIVEKARQHIADGDVYQIVPSRAWSAPCEDPLGAYARLRQINPSPYMFYLKNSHGVLLGASPESALKVDASSRTVDIRPIAGTRPRGRSTIDGTPDAELDARLELELRLSEKEIAEHVMLVDLARNDIARIALPSSRKVTELMHIERYSHVMHLVSRVTGELAPELDALHAYQATLNMGTLTGAPKVRAAELLRSFEPCRRGPYGGAVGYLNAHGDLDTAIVIRSALVQSGMAKVQAGAGIVADSDPVAEADETRRKAMAVLSTLGVERETDCEH